jgi:hypothetical protein
LLEDYGSELFDRFVAAVPEAHREWVRDPVVSRWYPEDNGAVCGARHPLVPSAAPVGDDPAAPPSPRADGARADPPRPGEGERRGARGRGTLRFTGQPYAADLGYRLATPAIVRSLMSVCVGQSARATLTHFDESTHVCDVSW